MIEQIKERFRNGYYKTNNITEKDMFYIDSNEELKNLFRDFFFSTDVFHMDSSVFSHYEYQIYIDLLLNGKNSLEEVKAFPYQFAKLYFQAYGWSHEEIDNLISFFGLDVEREYFENYINDYILNKDNNIHVRFNNENIEYILNNRKYELISYFDSDYNFSITPENRAALSEIVANNNIEIPTGIKIKLDLPVEKYTLEELIEKCRDKVLFTSESSEKYIPYERDLIKRLREKINNSDIEFIRNNIKDLNYLDQLLNNKLTTKELEILFKNGVISFYITERLIKENIINRDEIDDIFYDIILKSDNPFETTEKIIDKYYGSPRFNSDKSNVFFDKLIDNGYGLLINNNVAYLSREQLDRIKQVYYSGNNKIDTIPVLYNYEKINIDFLKFIFENFKIEKIVHYFSIFGDDNDLLAKQELLKKYILKDPNIEIDNVVFFEKNIFDSLLKQEKYNVLVTAINGYISKNITDEFMDWVKEHSDDTFLFHKIIRDYSFANNYNEKMFYPLLDNETIVRELIEAVVHNDNIKNKFSDEFYNRVKHVLAEQYGLDVSKMDLLEKHFGPNIIMYLEEKNIQKILNLDVDKIEKIISIFPKVDYELTDIEAAYESINQYSFGRQPQNEEVINIFPNILRVVNDKNVVLTNKYKYKILSIIDLETINNIIKKNNFDGSPIEFLDYILNHLDEKNVDILHEITNNVILQERKFYRNNHYYIDKENILISDLVQKCYDNEFLKKYIENFPASDLYEIITKFGIKEASEFCDLGKSTLPDDILKYRAILENIVRKKVNSLRENHPIGYTIFDELGLSYELDEKKKKSEVERHYLYRMDPQILNDLGSKLADLGYGYVYIYELFDRFKKQDFSNLTDKEKEDIKIFTKYALNIIRKKRSEQELGFEDSFVETYLLGKLDGENKIKRIFKANKSKDLYPVLMNLNIDLIEKNVFADDEIYELLIDIMKNKKIHMLDSAFYKVFSDKRVSILEDEASLAGFINFFKVIIDKSDIPVHERKKMLSHFSIVEILRQASTYSSMSSIYSSILGDEDARLVKRNPDPNSAKVKDTNTRFAEAVEDTITCYKKQNITIPTFDRVVPLDNGKSIEVIVGNFTSPCNITHGERTGACMRIGGVGESLYKFCLNEETGFHIRYEDPRTHKYISRVSGFRNGNTVYLNQLRTSLDKNYSNEDLIEASKQIANLLIEMTKDSENPIENVFVTNGYAMSGANVEKFRLDASEITKGLSNVYTDYTYSDACLLASTVSVGYVPLESKKVPAIYQPQRSKPTIVLEDMEIAPNLINRVHTVNQLLQGKTLENDEIEVIDFKEKILYCIANDDWYIYVDKNLEVKSEMINIDPRAKEEFEKYKSIVETMLEKGLVKERSHEYV